MNQGQRILANKNGFGSIARRESKKVYICALNGSSYGGGSELLVNCDIVIGIEGRAVVFPEVRRGVVAGVGGIPNAYLRSPMLMPYIYAGLPIPEHLLKAHIYTETVKTPDEVLPAALAWAASIVECSPEAVWVSKHQVNLYKAAAIQQVITNSVATPESIQLYDGANLKEGLLAFVGVYRLQPARKLTGTGTQRSERRRGRIHRESPRPSCKRCALWNRVLVRAFIRDTRGDLPARQPTRRSKPKQSRLGCPFVCPDARCPATCRRLGSVRRLRHETTR